MVIKAIEAAYGGNPDKALRILGHDIGNGMAQAVFNGQVGKYKLLPWIHQRVGDGALDWAEGFINSWILR